MARCGQGAGIGQARRSFPGVARSAALVDGFHSALYVQAALLVGAAVVGLVIATVARDSGRFDALPMPA